MTPLLCKRLTALICVASFNAAASGLSDAVSNYEGKGLIFDSNDNNYRMQVRGRIQTRFAHPGIGQPNDPGDYIKSSGDQFDINRARLKVGGHAVRDWVKYYWEYDLKDNRTLNATLALEKYDFLSVKVGQWKVEYSRERSVSSGGQQMVDRSIINRIFTLDRQQGISVYGHLDGGGAANVNYWANLLTGSGRGEYNNHDGEPMYSGRLQWNFLGEEVGFKNSDIKRSDKPKAAIAVAGAKYRSIYTRFSSSGAGALDNIDIGETPGQYDVDQYMIDAAYFYKGFNAQAEYHEKSVIDRVNGGRETRLTGYYGQAGYFLHEAVSWWPEPLEIAVRYATYDPDTSDNADEFFEQTLALNWFIRGHNNKITAEVSHLSMEQSDIEVGDRNIWRLQWDVSF